jgi:hypothetical protein
VPLRFRETEGDWVQTRLCVDEKRGVLLCAAGVSGYLRVAVHRFARSEATEIQFSHRPTIAALTFASGTKFKRLEIVNNIIALNIGRYMLGQMTAVLNKKQYYPRLKENAKADGA